MLTVKKNKHLGGLYLKDCFLFQLGKMSACQHFSAAAFFPLQLVILLHGKISVIHILFLSVQDSGM